MEVDPFGTAGRLLQWRDEWSLHGWSTNLATDPPRRIKDLADVESLANTAVAPSVGQRLLAVKGALQQRRCEIERIELVDSFEYLPLRWQEVLAEFHLHECRALSETTNCFLGLLQAGLKSFARGEKVQRLDWKDDGSVIVVQAETPTFAAHWLGSQLISEESALIVCGGLGDRLDGVLSALGIPRQGLNETSLFRPVLQVLPLALELLWEPLNIHALVQFLTHSVCPIPPFARRRLAEKISNSPGIGGDDWDRALDEIESHYAGIDNFNVRDQISYWVGEEHFSHKEGARVETIIERVKRLAEFFRRRLVDANDAVNLAYRAGYEQCQSTLSTLNVLSEIGLQRIAPRQLQKLVASATGSGSDNDLCNAEVGARRITTHPGAAFAPAANVIWWQLQMPRLPSRRPWSPREISALKEVGVSLPDFSLEMKRCAVEWLRPVMAARKRLLLVLPPPDEEVHPIWQIINSVVEQPRIFRLESLLSSGAEGMVSLPHVALPAARRWWTLPDKVEVPVREVESFTSSEIRLFNPYQWLLKYPAALRPSSLLAVQGDFRILGNLAHRVIERYFRRQDALSMSERDYNIWFDEMLPEVITQDGATLLLPGNGAIRENFRYRLHWALSSLRRQLSDANIKRISPERTVSGKFPGGQLTGMADLILENSQGAPGIVDIKWSGATKYLQKLSDNSHLQLAIYAGLIRQETGQWPATAYFILDRNVFITQDVAYFPGADGVKSSNSENAADLWQRFHVTWDWRTEQFLAGRFEVVLERTVATEESAPPPEGMAIEILNERYNDYFALAGWGEQE